MRLFLHLVDYFLSEDQMHDVSSELEQKSFIEIFTMTRSDETYDRNLLENIDRFDEPIHKEENQLVPVNSEQKSNQDDNSEIGFKLIATSSVSLETHIEEISESTSFCSAISNDNYCDDDGDHTTETSIPSILETPIEEILENVPDCSIISNDIYCEDDGDHTTDTSIPSTLETPIEEILENVPDCSIISNDIYCEKNDHLDRNNSNLNFFFKYIKKFQNRFFEIFKMLLKSLNQFITNSLRDKNLSIENDSTDKISNESAERETISKNNHPFVDNYMCKSSFVENIEIDDIEDLVLENMQELQKDFFFDNSRCKSVLKYNFIENKRVVSEISKVHSGFIKNFQENEIKSSRHKIKDQKFYNKDRKAKIKPIIMENAELNLLCDSSEINENHHKAN